MSVDLAIGLIGHRGSGKTSIARELVRHHQFKVVSFGDAVRAEAGRRGLEDRSTQTLQALGATLLTEWGAEGFSARVLEAAGSDGNLVIDGIRHASVLAALRVACAPRRFIVVFIDVPEGERRRRLLERDGDDGLRGDAHDVESEVERLRAKAALVVDGSSSEVVEDLLGRMPR